MSTNHEGGQPHAPRILMFSERNIYEQVVWRCPFYEFEGILQEIDSVDVLAPKPKRWYRQGKRVASRLGEYFKTPINPGVTETHLKREYDMFLAICEKPSEVMHLNSVKGRRDYCKTSVCWLTEFYVVDMPTFQSVLEVLSHFDHVIFMNAFYEPFRKLMRGDCSFLPSGIDAFLFCPYPKPPKRCIDVLSIGRRSKETHEALLRMVANEGTFYVYDTIDDMKAYSLEEHRMLLANLGKRSRYFIANPGKINLPEETGGQSEFGYRHFEGAAAGALLIGQRPNNVEFKKYFDWEDPVVDMPFGSKNVGEIMKALDRQPERQVKMRRDSMVQSLLRHDWAYRWEALLNKTGMAPLPQLLQRKKRLEQLAGVVAEARIEP